MARMSKKERQDAIAFFAFASPWIIGFVFLTVLPMLISLVISFTKWDILSPPKWTGLGNYLEMFSDPLFWKSLKVTFSYALFAVPINVVVSIFIAMLLNNKIRGMNGYRTIFYMPAVVSGVVVAIVWLWMFNPEFGVFNNILAKIGIEGPKWVYDEHWALPSLVLMSLWNVGGSIVIYLAALQNVPTELYEAAHIDGAGWWASFFAVTLPGISPVLLFTILTGIIGALQIFTPAFIMTNGGPNFATTFYAFYIYNNAFKFHKMGMASAQAWILFIIVFMITLIAVRVVGKYTYYEAKEGNII
jgi:multiple sugar transport system permease protein